MTDKLAIGVDVGGTKILAGVLDADGHVHETARRVTPVDSQDGLLDAFEAIVSELRTPQVGAVGFAIPARVDRATGIALGAVNVPLHELRLQAEMEARLGLPVALENDAGAATLAELRHGAARGAANVIMLTLGTGVGGGVVIDGALYRGWGELGHMVIVEDGEPCQGACTGRGHVESYCSGHAAGRLAVKVLGPGATGQDLVEQRHPALAEIGKHLGTAIGSLVNIFHPEVVVIGGGFGIEAGDLLVGPAREVIMREALAPGGDEVRLVLAELGEQAGMIGAGLVGLEALDG